MADEEIKKIDAAAAQGGETEAVVEKTTDKGDETSPEDKLREELNAKLATAEKRAEAAERERDTERAQKDSARHEAKTAIEKQVSAQEDAVKSAKSAAQSSFEAAQQAWDEAEDMGDKVKKRDAQIKLNDAQMRLRSAEYNEEQFNKWKESAKTANLQPERQYSKEEQTWIAENPRFKNDTEFKEAVYAADAVARARGIQANTPAYFKHVDDYLVKMNLKDDGSEEEGEEEKPKPVVKKTEKKTSTAAPPSGGTGSGAGSGSSGKTFKMTAAHQEAAQQIYADEFKKDPKVAYEKYAKRQMEIAERRANGEKI